MNFASDNWAGASDEVMAALIRHNEGFATAYGGDDVTANIEKRFCDVFETDCKIYLVATGTAANALALSTATGPGGAVFCQMDAHIRVDECGAPEFLSSGARMWGLDGVNGKLTPSDIQSGLEQIPPGVVHHGMANAISISQATEIGTTYNVDEISALSDLAKSNNLTLHMDGARFANALVHLNVTPAEMTWKAGIDLLSFGATKNGAWCAEAVIFFNERLAQDFEYRRKRAGHLFSKMRFASAQFDGYLTNDHWLDNARHANAMAQRLASGFASKPDARLAWPCQSNEVFAIVREEQAKAALKAGAMFHEWPSASLPEHTKPKSGECLIRLVCSYRSNEMEIDKFLDLI